MPRQKSTHVDDPRAVGERLKAARLAANLSQRQLAFSGCSPAYISRIEAGDRIPSLQLLRELGRRLGVSEDYLATGEESRFQHLSVLEAEIALRLDDQATAEQLYTEALERAATPRERSVAEEGLGHLAFRRGELREAIKLFEEALVTDGSTEWERPALAESLARAYALMGELAPSTAILERCLKVFKERDDTVEAIRFSCLLAAALADQSEFSRAEEIVTQALATGRQSFDPYTRARVYWAKAKLYTEQGDADGALRYAYQALAALELTEDLHYTAIAHLLIAQVELERGNALEALGHLEEGSPTIERTGSRVDRASFLVEQARARARLGERAEVEDLAAQITELLADEEPKEMIGQVYSVLGEVAAGDGEQVKAISYYETAARYLGESGPNRHLVDVYAKLADILEAEGRPDEAYVFMKRAVATQQTVRPKRHASA
jgi:transcriptional regulator with XRE-family HTH domain